MTRHVIQSSFLNAYARGLLATAIVLLGGCASTKPASIKAGAVTSPTGGVAIIFDERHLTELSYRRYELDADGSLRVGGGRTAQIGKTDWTGVPAPEDLRAILDAADAARLLDAEPACEPRLVDGDETIITVVEYAGPRGSVKRTLAGYCASLMPLRAAFERAASVRFKQQLDALPEAGVQKRRGGTSQ